MKARYYLYRNLHKNMFSIKYKGLVIDRSNYQIMRDVKLSVSQKGRAKVIKNKRKSVHATVNGFLVEDFDLTNYELIELYYNPYTVDSFVVKSTGEKIESCVLILAKDNRIYKLKERK